MKKVIMNAQFMNKHYRYEVHWVSPDGNDCLLGASHSIPGAERIAINQIEELMSNPFETNKMKCLFLENMYIWDAETIEDVTTDLIEDQTDAAMSQLTINKGE